MLFLSSNPAFNFDEVSPRYFPNSGEIFMLKHIDVKTKKQVPEEKMSFAEIKKFLKTRIQISPARNNKDKTLRIPLKNGGTIAVPYWACVKNNTELLLQTTNLKNTWTGLNPSQRAREIMKYAVCMEIVPFRSNEEKGVDNAKDKCWNDFTKYLLELSAASVIVLVGDKVLNMFTDLMKNLPLNSKTVLARESSVYKNSRGKPKHDGIVKVRIGKIDRLVVKVNFNRGKFSRFGNFFTPHVIAELQNAVASSFVKKAIQPSVSN